MKLSPKLSLPIPEGSDIHNLVNFVALLNAIDNNAAPLGTITGHINNKNNPHAVTKEQLGLGQVNNVPQYSKTDIDSKLAALSKASQLPADSVPATSAPASYPTGATVMTVTTGYPGATTNSPKTIMTVRGTVDRGSYQLLIGSGDTAPQNRIYDGSAWGAWFTIATTLSNVASATKLANTRRIGGVAFDGTSDITLPGVNAPGNQPTSGKAATAGRADSAGTADTARTVNKLTTARRIGGVAFDGLADIDLPGVNITGNQDTSGRAATAGRAETSGIADAANKLSTPRKIGGVTFDGSAPIDLPGVNVPGNQPTTGKAATAGVADSATQLANTRKIGGVNFDATSDIDLPGVNVTGNQNTSGRAATAGRAETAGAADVAARLKAPRQIGGVAFDGSQNIDLPGVNTAGNQDTSGKAATAGRAETAGTADVANTAIKLNVPRKIGGVNFDGSADITLPGVNAPGNQDTSGKAATAGKADAASYADVAATANVMAVKSLADSTDLDTIKTTGLYQWWGANFKNSPVAEKTWGYMHVISTGGAIMQTFYTSRTQRVYRRTLSGSPIVWNAWQKVIFDGDKIANATRADTANSATTANDPQAVHLSGDQTIAGNKTFNGQILANLPLVAVPDADGNVLIGKSSNGNRGLIQQIAGTDRNGDLVGLGAGGTTIVGSGESTPGLIAAIKAGKVPAAFGTLYGNGNVGTEATIVASDGNAYILTNYQNSGTNGSVVKVGTDGYIYHWVNGAWVKSALVTDKIANATYADTANKLQTTRTIGGVGFDGTANINLPGVNTPGNQPTTGNAATATTAASANKLTTARTIAGVSFDGTANVVIPAGNVGAYTKAEVDAKYLAYDVTKTF